MEELNIFYVYILRRPDWHDPYYVWLSCPFYVGKGCGRRSKMHIWEAINYEKNGESRNNHKDRIINKLWRIGLDFEIEYYAINLTEEEAFRIEKKLINKYGRMNNGTGILVNMTDGGEGSTGFRHTEESLRKMLDNRVYVSGENNPCFGKKRPEEIKQKLRGPRLSVTGENNPNYGKHWSEEHKQRYLRGPHSPEHIRKMAEAKTGVPHSEEAKQKMSESQKKRRRLIILEECGYEDWLRCKYCHKLDDPKKMYVSKDKYKRTWHRECKNKFEREKYHKNKLKKEEKLLDNFEN